MPNPLLAAGGASSAAHLFNRPIDPSGRRPSASSDQSESLNGNIPHHTTNHSPSLGIFRPSAAPFASGGDETDRRQAPPPPTSLGSPVGVLWSGFKSPIGNESSSVLVSQEHQIQSPSISGWSHRGQPISGSLPASASAQQKSSLYNSILYDTAPPGSSSDRPSASIISNEFSFKPDLQHARNPQLANELKQLNVQLQNQTAEEEKISRNIELLQEQLQAMRTRRAETQSKVEEFSRSIENESYYTA
eukprot:CAMPEP_0198232940 /NCGR_PEP_ID=MMETSP1445-20131203/115987_1 /TAXON_ID=36898 /ORGANISM="Pyramimonas sp., Strain CCMP2087" /LENGTH=246 /DNA_ID=CAMNT_0043913627 /DNA_START=548 /DNA_END=1288 /DNA_ORIENTATION=-